LRPTASIVHRRIVSANQLKTNDRPRWIIASENFNL